MTFDELVQAVRVELKRYDLMEQIHQGIKSVLLAEHAMFDYDFDTVEENYSFATSSASQSLALYTEWPYLRELKKVYVLDSADGEIIYALDKGAARSLLSDNEIFRKTNIWYIGGTTLNLKASAEIQHIKVVRMDNPDVTEDGLNSWLATYEPHYIIHKVAAKINKDTLGKMDVAQSQLASAAVHFSRVVIHRVDE